MEIKQIKELMATMGRTGTKRLSLKKEGFELEIEREENGFFRHTSDVSLGALDFSDDPSFQIGSNQRANAALLKGKDLSASFVPPAEISPAYDLSQYITSPMVGTFYSASSPEDPAFIKIGDKVDKNSMVCIIEAMKVMNEIKANVVGTIVEVLVDNGSPVEFGTKLFRIS